MHIKKAFSALLGVVSERGLARAFLGVPGDAGAFIAMLSMAEGPAGPDRADPRPRTAAAA